MRRLAVLARSGTARLRACLGALAALAFFAIPAAGAPDLTGTWQGAYDCAQGRTGLTLTLTANGKGSFLGRFAFFPVKENPGVPSGSFGVFALHDEKDGTIRVDPRLWIERPAGFVTVPLLGKISEDGQVFEGEVPTEGCGRFLLRRFLS